MRVGAAGPGGQETDRGGGKKGGGWGEGNFSPPSLSDSDFSAAAEFRISLCEMRRQEICLIVFIKFGIIIIDEG